jgi:long-chain acyl-CoA synthetase
MVTCGLATSGYLDADGYLFIVTGKDIIIRGGEKLLCEAAEVRNCLCGSEGIARRVFRCARRAAGRGANRRILHRRGGEQHHEEELRAFLAGRLAAFKIPRC